MSGAQFCVNILAKTEEPAVPPFFLQFDPLLLLPPVPQLPCQDHGVLFVGSLLCVVERGFTASLFLKAIGSL